MTKAATTRSSARPDSGERIRRLWHSHSRPISVSALVILALVVLLPRLVAPVGWSVDGLFYQAQVLELQGKGQTEALHQVFSSKTAADVVGATRLQTPGFRRWVKYSARFYRRRWVVPAMAAAIYPAAGGRSLLYVSLLGYIATGLLLFALLRRRFSDAASLVGTAICLLLPPMRAWSGHPLTDSWGLALEVGALLAALLAFERGGRWIAMWFLTMLVLSFTRDASLVLLVAVAAVTLVTRTRRGGVILGTGILASLPAPAAFGVPFLQQLAYNIDGFRIPGSAHWSYVLAHYPSALWSVLRDDVTYIRHFAGYPVLGYVAAAALCACVGYMFVAAPRRDVFFGLQKGAIVGAVLTVALAVNFTDLRLELAFVPAVAASVAFAFQRLILDKARPRLAPLLSTRIAFTSDGRRA